MNDHDLAERLLAVVVPTGDRVIKGAMRAGEDVAAIIDLIEQAAIHNVALPRELLDAVAEFADDPALADDDVADIRQDLTHLRSLSPALH